MPSRERPKRSPADQFLGDFVFSVLWLRGDALFPLSPASQDGGVREFDMNVGVDSNGRVRERKKSFIKCLLKLQNIIY